MNFFRFFLKIIAKIFGYIINYAYLCTDKLKFNRGTEPHKTSFEYDKGSFS